MPSSKDKEQIEALTLSNEKLTAQIDKYKNILELLKQEKEYTLEELEISNKELNIAKGKINYYEEEQSKHLKNYNNMEQMMNNFKMTAQEIAEQNISLQKRVHELEYVDLDVEDDYFLKRDVKANTCCGCCDDECCVIL